MQRTWNHWIRLCSMGMTSKWLTKRVIRDIAEAVSGKVPATFYWSGIKEDFCFKYVATFADHVAFTETLQRHKEDFSSLLQHMADCYKALFAGESSCTSASIAITHPANEFKNIHALRENINGCPADMWCVTVSFYKRDVPRRDRWLRTHLLCTLGLVYMYRIYNEDEGLSDIHDRGRSPRTCIFDDPKSELYNRLVPECGGVSVSYWFIWNCPMKFIR